MIAFLAYVALAISHPTETPKPYCGHRCHVIRIERGVVAPWRAKLERIAWCESRRRWHLATGNGFYGGVQFTLRTWYAAGGRGYPHLASKLEQMYRAVIVFKMRGGSWRDWPVCGYA